MALIFLNPRLNLINCNKIPIVFSWLGLFGYTIMTFNVMRYWQDPDTQGGRLLITLTKLDNHDTVIESLMVSLFIVQIMLQTIFNET
jgi:hypothetical protein